MIYLIMPCLDRLGADLLLFHFLTFYSLKVYRKNLKNITKKAWCLFMFFKKLKMI
jgi:hypothetical protein